MKDKPFLALCECAAETLQVSLFVEPNTEIDGYLSFSSWWQQNPPWRDRFKLVWLALRGKEHYFAEVILDREDCERLQWYLASRLQQCVHIDFTTHANTASTISYPRTDTA